MELIKNNNYDLEITGVTSEGSGVGKLEGFAVFVPDTTIGDYCSVKLVKINKNFAYGKLEKLIAPAPTRIAVDCNRFVQCGGCTYRHISYQAELSIKADFVANAFTRIGGISLPHDAIIGSERQTAYRNKAQYPISQNQEGKTVSGFYAKRSHRIIEQDSCLLQPQFFSDIQQDVIKFLHEEKIAAYDEKKNTGIIRHLYIRYAEMTGDIMVCLVATTKRIPQIERLVQILTEKYKGIKSIVVNVNKENTNVILGTACTTVYGEDSITDVICGIKVKLSPLSFYQVNRQQAEVLYDKAIEFAELKDSDTLLDLYCGVGTIGLTAAKHVRRLIGVEIVEQAIENAKENAQRNHIENAQFICADAGKAASMLVAQGERPHVIIVDPPRKGLDADVIEAIVKMAPDRVVMVSCNPTTAARDCKLLQEQGYAVQRIAPVDMFPRTAHVECVCLLTNSSTNRHV